MPDSDSGRADSTSALAILPGDLARILERIEGVAPRGATRLVAIDGRGGAGKTSIAKELVSANPTIRLLQVDRFPCTAEEHPFDPAGIQPRISVARLVMALLPLVAGDTAFFETTSWVLRPGGQREAQRAAAGAGGGAKLGRLGAGGTVLVEGSYSLLPSLRPLYDLSIWVECEVEVALRRARERDGEAGAEPGGWELVHVPNQERYISTHRPDLHADIILESGGGGPVRVARI